MPLSSKETHIFYGPRGEAYPFYAKDYPTAIRYATAWSRRTGIKLRGKRPRLES